MGTRKTEVVFDNPLVRIADVACRAPASACGPEEWSDLAHVVLPRRGVFLLHRGGEEVVADANTALVFGADEHYRVSHPIAGGDQCTVLLVAPAVLEDGLGSHEARHGTLRASTQLATRVLTAALKSRALDDLEAEDRALQLFDALCADLVPSGRRDRRRTGRMQRQRVEQVRALLAQPAGHPLAVGRCRRGGQLLPIPSGAPVSCRHRRKRVELPGASAARTGAAPSG